MGVYGDGTLSVAMARLPLADYIALLLERCLKVKVLKAGRQVHAWLVTSGFNLNVFSINSKLVGMYASCGDLRSASMVFDKIQNPNVFALNWMILASTFNGFYKEAIGYLCLGKESIYLYNKFTFSIALKACVGILDLNKGKEVHAMVKELGSENDLYVANALINMYGKCGCLSYARKVFDRMLERDVTSWTSMICGYCNVGKVEEAFLLFERMKLEGVEPNSFTWNMMIGAYARKGDSEKAFTLFSRMTTERLDPDLATWNALISGLVQGQKASEALKLFRSMLLSGIKPNVVTVTGLLPACGAIGSIQRGREIHGLIYRTGLDINVFVASALIDMYSKCGDMNDAYTVFEKTNDKNIASWNAMIGCYGKHGIVESSIHLLKRMKEEKIQANEVTLVSVLSACSHGGLVEKGLKIFRSMKDKYGVEPNREHYACVVDMLCRSGKMIEAYELVKEMPMEVTESILGAFYNGCMIHGRRDLGKMMAENIMQGDLKTPASFATFSNIHAACGEWKEVLTIRNAMKDKKFQKMQGFSQIEENDGFVGTEKENEKECIEMGPKTGKETCRDSAIHTLGV